MPPSAARAAPRMCCIRCIRLAGRGIGAGPAQHAAAAEWPCHDAMMGRQLATHTVRQAAGQQWLCTVPLCACVYSMQLPGWATEPQSARSGGRWDRMPCARLKVRMMHTYVCTGASRHSVTQHSTARELRMPCMRAKSCRPKAGAQFPLLSRGSGRPPVLHRPALQQAPALSDRRISIKGVHAGRFNVALAYTHTHSNESIQRDARVQASAGGGWASPSAIRAPMLHHIPAAFAWSVCVRPKCKQNATAPMRCPRIYTTA